MGSALILSVVEWRSELGKIEGNLTEDSMYAVSQDVTSLHDRVAEYLNGIIPDGFEFDARGGIWCASVMSNRLLRLAPDGTQTVLLEDCDPHAVAQVMTHWERGTFTREHMNIGASRELRNIASVTFGGPDLKTVYLGSLFGESLFRFRSPIAGAPPPHWNFQEPTL